MRYYLPSVAASAAEAELPTLFLNAKETKILQLTLEEMGYLQPKRPIHVNNTTMMGIVNSNIKHQLLRTMEMRYFWLFTCTHSLSLIPYKLKTYYIVF